jgi:ubiquinone biosynthesis protein UbiJ
MLAAAASRIANHLLEPAEWAREKLAPHAGKAARFEFPPGQVTLQVAADGRVGPADTDAPPAVVIRFRPETMLRTLADREQAWRSASIEGDSAFAADISHVATHLGWDVEEDLSKVFGDIAAHRMAQAGRTAAGWPGQAARSLAQNTAEYLTEEAKLLASPLQVTEFVRDVDELRDAAERLEKRIEQLTRRP